MLFKLQEICLGKFFKFCLDHDRIFSSWCLNVCLSVLSINCVSVFKIGHFLGIWETNFKNKSLAYMFGHNWKDF